MAVDITPPDNSAEARAIQLAAAIGSGTLQGDAAVNALLTFSAEQNTGGMPGREEAFRAGYREGQADAPTDECDVSLRLFLSGMEVADKSRPASTLPGRGVADALWQRACIGREGYCSSDLQDAAKWAIGEAFAMAERAARSATLPPGYQWSEGNREKFDFGRDSAADAILSLAGTGGTGAEGWRLVADGEPVSLAECPPGPFAFDGTLAFRTEYGAMSGKDVGCGKVEWSVTHWPDAYSLDTGEVFWGGATTRKARSALIVQPLAALPLSPIGDSSRG